MLIRTAPKHVAATIAPVALAIAAVMIVVNAVPGAAQGQAQSGDPAPLADFASFVDSVRTEALLRGISAETVEQALTGLTPSEVVVQRDRSQVEIVLTVDEYVRRRVTPGMVRTARRMAAQHRGLLARVAERYGVPSPVLVAVWGLESNFGRFSGVRPTIQALATLAWEGRRGVFFRGELMHALEIVDRGHIGLPQLRGSWAGAMGQPQFMPSSYLAWAEDFDADGDRDIWTSLPDVFASIANYLKAHGWASEYTWGREVRLPAGGIDAMRETAGMRIEGCRAEREMTMAAPLSRWQERGVRTTRGVALPDVAIDASLIHTGSRAFLVYGNYEALLQYNCAHTYALAVALLADQL